MQDFRNLKVWQKAHELALAIYAASRTFPKEELYGITSQLRRAATSVPANLAEGCCRHGDAEFSRFAQIALASTSELEYFLLLARDLSMLDDSSYKRLDALAGEVRRMLIAFIQTLRASMEK